nr:heterogeneous nuclear ribonucleoprotein 1 [Tanacetum cinerariifolium]
MAERKIVAPTTAEKGKAATYTPEIISLKNIRPTRTNKTIKARVYRKWTAMNVTTKEPTNFCCILIDKQGGAIQANINVRDTDHFNRIFEQNNAYRITRFVCTETKNGNKLSTTGLHRSLENTPTSNQFLMTFSLSIIFRFAAYNEIDDLADVSGTPLIEGFDMAAYADMPKPVVIAVSSTWATRKYGSTPATHYYLNLNIPEATCILNVYGEFINPMDALEIQRQPYIEESQEQMRNRYCIETLLNVNLQHYKYGDITDSVIMKDRMTGQPRGFGFITYADHLVVDKVIQETHVFSEKQVEIKRAIPRETVNLKGFKTKKIFVGGIPTSLGEDELATFFSKYGKVVEHQIVRDHGTNRSRGIGFVVFDSVEVVDELVSNGNMIDMGGNQVKIKKPKPKKGLNPPFVSRSRSRSFPDKFSGYDGAASGGPGYYDGVGLRHRRYAPWRAFEGPGIPNGSRFGPYGAPEGTGSGYTPYGPERVGYYGRYGKCSSIGGYGDCDGYLGESSCGDASRFGSDDEYDPYRGSKMGAGGGPDSGPGASYGGSYGSGGYSGGSHYHPY